MKTIKQKYTINASPDAVWQAFVDPQTISKWGGGPAKMDDQEGTRFSLWGGDIYGTNTKVVKNKLIKQDWYGGKWDQSSRVSFHFSGTADKAEVKLTQTNVPESDASDIDKGWKDYYLGPIKELLEKS